ncbi:MAG: TerB family tellurite resistance protein [Bacteroidales bacterium]|jgi:tellurite resistance protein TerB
MFGNVFNKFKNGAKKVQNKELMEAIVAGVMLVGMADGSIGQSESEKIEKLLAKNENLDGFKPSEIREVMTKYEGILDADFMVGQQKMMKEITEISGNSEQAEEVFLNVLAVAKADGEVDEKEKAVLVKVGSALRINLKDYGV